MGGKLGGVFSGEGQGDNGAPTALQKIFQGTAKGAISGAGKQMQGQGTAAAPSQILQPGSGPAPVDAGYFQPTNFQNPTMKPQSAFYGG